MKSIKNILHRVAGRNEPLKDTDPFSAYNIWAKSYDEQPDNLMLALDDQLFSGLLDRASLENKTIVDVGCGTGRHWSKIQLRKPQALIGYDISVGMLERLMSKYPSAIIHQMQDNFLPELKDASIDVIVSTLTIAHIEHIEEALKEWNRVLKTDGNIIITDYHPEAFIKGANRTFVHNKQTIAIKNYTHKIDWLQDILINTGFEMLHFTEKRIDASMKHYYEEKQALHVFDKFNNVPIIYGMHLKKANDIK